MTSQFNQVSIVKTSYTTKSTKADTIWLTMMKSNTRREEEMIDIYTLSILSIKIKKLVFFYLLFHTKSGTSELIDSTDALTL